MRFVGGALRRYERWTRHENECEQNPEDSFSCRVHRSQRRAEPGADELSICV